MVTNTGTTAETASIKENGECVKDQQTDNIANDDVGNLKQSADEATRTPQPGKSSGLQQNDPTNTMSSTANESTEHSEQLPAANGLPANQAFSNSRSYGNGVPTNTAPINGPQPNQGAPYQNYGGYNHGQGGYMPKNGARPMHGGPNYPPMARYPNASATPTLNQLLTTPSRYPNQQHYNNHSNAPSEYNQNQPQQNWQARPQQYPGAPPSHPPKPEMGGYPQQQPQYPSQQQPGYPHNAPPMRYPPQSAQGAPYSQQQQYDPYMPPPGSSGYPPSSNPSRHPAYQQGYPNYMQQHPQQHQNYYGQRPPQTHSYPPSSYGPTASNPPTSGDSKNFGAQVKKKSKEESMPTHTPAPPQQPAESAHLHGVEQHMMSPNRRTPQPMAPSHPASVQSPMTASQSPHIHHSHPTVAQLRGPSPAPSSPSSTGQPRVNPLSPPLVRPSTPHQQGAMRPPSEASESAGQSPMHGSGYGHYRNYPPQPLGPQQSPYPPQHSNQGQPTYPQQHMVSPQQQQMYPSNQQYPTTPQHHGGPMMRPTGPPSGGKPAAAQQALQTPSYSQNQPSPGYQQPGNCAPYYDNMAQQHHIMHQGYSTPSPAPSERRPSRQGSHPSAAGLPPPSEAQGRQGAAAAAAAAMAAAAHTAQPGTPVPPTKPGTPSYYPQQQPQQNLRRPTYHGGQPGGEMYPSNMGYPRMPHPGPPGSNHQQRMMGPQAMGSPSGEPGMQHMPPPASNYPAGYPQSGPPHQGHYLGYPGNYPHPHGDPNQPMHPQGYPAPPVSGYGGYESQQPAQQPADETPKPKSTARSASQKLNALFEPADEPGRREFIESVFKYWDDKDLPLKNAPLMGRKTLDLFRLYQLVKERGFWLKVTESKQWADISTQMGLGSTSTSGFTLKKQYCKYLYGYECRMERGEEEPQEAMARVIEANRKKKLQAEQQAQKDETSKATTPSTPVQPSGHPPQPPHPPPGQSRYPSQPYPQGHYPPQQMGPGYGPQGYMQQPQTSDAPHPGAYPPPHAMQRGVPPRQGLMPGYPPGHPSSTYPGSQGPAPAPFPPTSQPAPVEKAPSMTGSQTPQSITPAPTPDETEPPKDNTQASAASIKPPVPVDTSLAAGNPFNEPSKQQGSTLSQPPPGSFGYPHAPPGPQHQRAMPPHDPYQRGGYPPRPGMPPSQPPYSNSPSPYMRPQSHHGLTPGTPHQAPSPRSSPAYPQPLPGHPLPARSSYSGQPPYSGSHGSYPMSQHYPVKRPSTDVHGPPNKYNRADIMTPSVIEGSYSMNHPPYRPDHDPRHRSQIPPNYSTFSNQRSRVMPPHPHSPYDPRHVFNRRPTPMSISSNFKHDPLRRWDPHGHQRVSSPIPYRKMQRSVYPPGSVEATMPRMSKTQKKSGKDVGVVEAWRVVMALKSGLLVESSWALNALTIFLYDQQTVAQMKLAQLPGLLDALVEHYRRCLCELFALPGETEALGVAGHTLTSDEGKDFPLSSDVEPDYTFTAKPKQRGRKRKNCVLLSKYSSKFSSIPVKVEQRSDPFVVDRSDTWDTSDGVDLQDDLSHIVLNISRVTPPNSDEEKKSAEVDQSLVVVEATLEDVLSIPCSVLFPDEYDIHGNSSMEVDSLAKVADKEQSKTVEEAAKPDEETDKESSHGDDVTKDDTTDVKVLEKVDKKLNGETKPCDDVSDKLNDVTNKSDDVTMKCDVIKKHNNVTVEEGGKKSDETKIKEELTSDSYPVCNGIQSDDSSSEVKSNKDEGMNVDPPVEDEVEIKKEVDEVKNPETDKEKSNSEEIILPPPSSRVTYRVEKVLEERNVILLEDEALASDGSMSEIFSGTVVPSKTCNKLEELSNRLQCISNIIRGLSFVPSNSRNLCQHRSLMRAVSGSLLLRHKHRTRPRHVPTEEEENLSSKDEETTSKDPQEHPDIGGRIPSTKYFLKSSDFAAKKTRTSELFAPDNEKSDANKSKKRPLFSATVFDEDDEECRKAYSDPWWWDCVHRIREDSLVILSNVAPALDLSKLPDDHTALAVIEACLHWTVCPSSDANDTFFGKLRPQYISPQRLSLEILTKLTIKEHNIDLILAARPFSRIEKLFSFLVGLLCDRKEQTMREFAVVLLCNLSSGDVTAARAIALQKGSLSGLISFLEESEEYGINHRRMLPSAPIDCHTTPFMMLKCARTLLALAQVHENKSGFVKYQLRLLSLSMSQFLAPNVTSTITSVLFEVSHCAT